MRLAAVASLLTAGMIAFATGIVPPPSQAYSQAASCSTCGKAKSTTLRSCAHCKAGEECPHCDGGQSCAYCQGDGHPGYHGHHGKWGAHKWEYKCVRPRRKAEAMSQQFTAMGDQGWRLNDADGGIWCFARMKPSK